MQRLIAGDFNAVTIDFGSSLNIGGLSLSKIYSINPYFIKHPLAGFSGFASLPSEIEIYVDGVKVRSERISPGEFDLRNISYYGGAGAVEVLLKDPFGKVERILHPFYFTDALLGRGLHEYSYSAGFLREDFGASSSRYGGPAFSAFHRYAPSDALTVAFRAEAVRDRMSGGPQATFRLGKALGIVSTALSISSDRAEGSSHSGGFNPRKMAHESSSDMLDYNLFTDASKTAVWGDGSSGTSTVTMRNVKRDRPPKTAAIYGSLPPGQNVPAGRYSETLTITILW